MAIRRTQALNDLEPIVNSETGAPSHYFMRALQDRAITLDGNSEDIEFLQTVRVIGGVGIDGEGALGDGDITLDANVQEILDLLGTTQGSIIYRNASDWVVLGPGTSGYFLKTQGPGANPVWDASAGAGGTVTSVAMTVPTGLSISGSPITTSGTLAVTFTAGYSIPTTASQTNWNTAFGWGNHAVAGYLDSGDIGVTVQAYDTQLASLAGLSYTGNGQKHVAVNVAENAFELVDATSILEIDCGIATNSGTPYIAIDGGSA
jgi:hypothetical protein